MHGYTTRLALALAIPTALAACGGAEHEGPVREAAAAQPAGTIYIARDSVVPASSEASGIAEPVAQATVSTKLMGTVLAVLVKEGDRVRAGQVLARIDARDLDAKRRQVQAGIAGAEAMEREAQLMAARMRALYADSAAPKAQLDAAESGLARAEAGVEAARAGEAELDAVAGYSVIRAPFTGVVTQRFVDPGAFAAPGAPLVSLQDDSRLRLSVTIAPSMARTVRRGARVDAAVEGVPVTAIVEGVVPTAMGSLYTINAIAENRDGGLVAGGSATVAVGEGTRHALLVPTAAIRREGELTGVALRRGTTTTRWVRLGRTFGESVEVLSGLTAGDTVLVPIAPSGGR